jgi:tetratricopeptide (TPR) repeat protein
MASSAYGYGAAPYTNPYAGGAGVAGVGGGQPGAQSAAPYDYSQPVNTAAAAPDAAPDGAAGAPPADPQTSPGVQAQQAFHGGDYASALQFAQQAISQAPNDVNLHQFLALVLFAQGNYEQAAAPLYAVLSVGPGWDWTTLIGNYGDASAYTTQLRGLEGYTRSNPKSAAGQFVLAYHYISQGQGSAAIKPLEAVIALRPDDKVSAQILASLQPPTAEAPAAQLDPASLTGQWVARGGPQGASITLTLSGDGGFTWTLASPGKAPSTISGGYTVANNVLTLAGKDAPGGPLAGQVTLTDDKHMTFKAVGGAANDPGLMFAK